MDFSVNSRLVGIDFASFLGNFVQLSATAPFSPHRALPGCSTFQSGISKARTLKIVPLIRTVFHLSATVALLCGCTGVPQAAYERLLSVNDNLVSHTLDDARAAAKVITLIPKKEEEILISESDPVFDAGWTRSYFKVFAMEGELGRSYLVTVRSICRCFGPLNTILSPYIIAFDDRGEVIAEGPDELKLNYSDYTLHYHLEGKFDLLTGTRKSMYLLVFGDNRDVGSTLWFWLDRSSVLDEEGVSHETTTEMEIVSHPEGILRLKVEERE